MSEDLREKVARAIAEALGDDLDHAFVNKSEWNAARGEKGGRYRDINEPMREEYLAAAHDALNLIGGDGWKPIDDGAPRDGTLFLGCNLDHPSFGSWVMCRRVRHAVDRQGEMTTEDLGGWNIIRDLEPDYQEGHEEGPGPAFSIAADEWNRSVRYGWRPLPPPPVSS
jgi:hypothetical protein